MNTVIAYAKGSNEVLIRFRSGANSFLSITQIVEEKLGLRYGVDFTLTVY